MHYPDYLLVGVAVVISHVVTSLGQQVAKAREMGSYQLGELLGRGGMGEVYRATHRMLARPAAIKLIRPEMIGAGDAADAQLAVTRFRREAEAAANLRSPHTVELYDFGVTDDETLYFVMELLDGMDLESLVRQHGPHARRPRGAHPPSGVRIARRGARARSGAPGHQARQHSCRPAGARRRLRQGARLRPRQTDRRRERRAVADDASRADHRDARLHGPRVRARRERSMDERTSTRSGASPTTSSPASRSSTATR